MLTIINLVISILSIISIVYILGKVKQIEYFLDNMEDPKKLITEIMKTKIPIIFDRDGQPIPLTDQGMPKPEGKNPLVG